MDDPFLIGPRLYLRPVELEDGERVRRWLNHPDVRRHLLRTHPLTRHGEEEYLRDVTTKDTERVLLIVVREGDAPIGVIGLHGITGPTRQAELGIAIGEPDRWGQGHGAEAIALLLEHAFGELNLRRVHLHVDADHPRGLRCYEKAGFVREGVLRDHTFRAGRFSDTVVMSVLAPEWHGRRPAS